MTDIVLSTEDLMVLGGPDSVTVDVNYGPQGDRGSRTFAGEGIPNAVTVTDLDAQIFDMYINISPSSDEYMYLYQLSDDGVGGTTWNYLLKLVPSIFNDKKTFIFNDGYATANISVSQIVDPGIYSNITSDRLNTFISITPSGTKPIASSVILGDMYLDSDNTGQWVVPVNIYAAEFASGTWQNLGDHTQHPTGEARTVRLLISVV